MVLHLKLETLRLNDEKDGTISDHLIPTESEVCEEIIDMWNGEPSSEDLPIDQLYDKLMLRCPLWKITVDELGKALVSHNLYTANLNNANTYSASSSPSTLTDDDIEPKKLLSKVNIKDTEYGKGLCATQFLTKGTLIFHESTPVSIIPQLDKQSLVMRSKCCGLCSTSLTQSSQFVIKNNLDCSGCDTVWCSKSCKRLDTSHAFLRHGLSRNGVCSSANWTKFEDYCLKYSLHLVYAVGILYSRHIIDPSSHHWRIFKSLCSMDHHTPLRGTESKYVSGVHDAHPEDGEEEGGDNKNSTTLEERWVTAFGLLQNTFYKMDMIFDEFLRLVSCFSLNQIMGQVYPLASHINHSCEPNVRYELDPKYGIKIFSRKDIKEGEQLFLTYVNPLHPVALRRRALRVNYGFSCQCKRCCQEQITKREEAKTNFPESVPESVPFIVEKRRKSSMKSTRPSLKELLESGTEFDLEIPSEFAPKRRTSVRFDSNVTLAVEEDY